MSLRQLLSAERVLAATNGTRKKDDLLKALTASIAATVPTIAADALLSALKEREKLGSTALEGGVALPHARIAGLPQSVAAFARSPSGVDWESPDAGLSHLILLLVTPAEQAAAHLKLLAAASRVLRDPACKARLLEAADSAAILGIINDCENHIVRD